MTIKRLKRYFLMLIFIHVLYLCARHRIEDQPRESWKWEFIRTISDLVVHTHIYVINWNYKNYKKKVTIAYICLREGKTTILTILYLSVLQFLANCSSNFTSSNNCSSDLSLCSLQYFLVSFWYNIYMMEAHIFTKLCKYFAWNADGILRYSQIQCFENAD